MSYVPPSWSGPPSQPPEPPRRGPRLPSVSSSRLIVVAVILGILVLAQQRGTIDIVSVVIIVAVTIPAVVLHEISHGWAALAFGDRTAKNAGRLTLNPIKHVDILGTLIIPFVFALSGFPPIGYAKPVPVNVVGMSRNQALITSLVGPLTNVVLALLVVPVAFLVAGIALPEWLLTAILYFGLINVSLAVFNLIPIPPLDGSAIIDRFLPRKYLNGYYTFRKYSIFILLALFLVASPVVRAIISPFQEAWLRLLPSEFLYRMVMAT